MIIMRYSTRRTCIGVLAAILLLFLLMVAQSVTASDEQGGTPQTLTPMPERTTIPIGPAPLTLTKTVSTDAVLPGQSFAYTLRIATSREQARAEVRDILDRGVEVLGIESESGACTSAGIIICTVQVKAQEPATILITVRAHATVAPDTWLAAQALAQDDRDFTAASERVSVRVVAPPPVMSAPVAAAPSAPEAPSAGAAPPPERQTAPESRAASRMGAVLSSAPQPTAIPPTPATVPPLSRAAGALSGAVEPAAAAPIDTMAQEPPTTPNGEDNEVSWLDLVTTVNP